MHVEFQGRVLICRVQDVRKTLTSWLVYISNINHDVDLELMGLVKFAQEMQSRETIQLGYVQTSREEWKMTPQTQ